MTQTLNHHETSAIEQRLMRAAKKLKELAPLVGMAKTIKAYDGDRRKQILAVEVVKAMKNGAESATAAEHIARASDEYAVQFQATYDSLKEANKTEAEWDAEFCAYETARSLLSFSKETLRQL